MAKMNFNIDFSKIKVSDVLKVFQVFKGFKGLRVLSVLIWPGVILLASCGILVAAWFMGSSLKQNVAKTSLPMGNKVKSMLKTSPVTGQVEVEKRYQGAFERDVNLIKQLSVQGSERELLSYDIFPKPKDTSTLLFTRFGTRFCQGIDGLLAKVNARGCPSPEELSAAREAAGSASSRFVGGASKIIDEICQSRAKSASVYASPQSACGYDFWQTYQYANMDDSIKDCWYWQLGYWIIEDVFSTVEKINGSSKSVFTSPVKRIVRVGFVTPDALAGATGGDLAKGAGPQDRPKYVTKQAEQLTESFTARLGNDEIDVVHFSAILVVSSKSVIPFMLELCSGKEHKFAGWTGQEPERVFKHNQITILESRVRPVDITSGSHLNYRYGSDSVVEVEIVCEYIFNKTGYDAIKPEQVKPVAAPTGG
jgi:hypothetical protein